MEEKTLGVIAQEAWRNELANDGHTAEESWQAVADAVIAEYERRRWKAAYANLPSPPKEASDAE
jgi:hypothetical protein